MNGIAERFNQTIITCTRSLLYTTKINSKFWDFAIMYTNHLYNITPKSSIKNKIPNTVFYNKKVNLSKIKVFGCITLYHSSNNIEHISKVKPKSKKGIFLCIDFHSNSYIIMDLNSNKIKFIREVIFLENTFINFIQIIK